MNVSHQFLSLGQGNKAPSQIMEEEKVEINEDICYEYDERLPSESFRVGGNERWDLEESSSPKEASSSKEAGRRKKGKSKKDKKRKSKKERIVIIPPEDCTAVLKKQEELLMNYPVINHSNTHATDNSPIKGGTSHSFDSRDSMESQGYECGIDNKIEELVADLHESKRTVSTFDRSASMFLCIDSMTESEDGGNQNRVEASPQASTSFLNQMKHHYRLWRKDLMSFKLLKVLQVLLAIIGGILTLSPAVGLRDPETGLIVDQGSSERTENGLILVNGVQRAIVASSHGQVICIGITRMTAFFMYPALVMVYGSKFRATTSFLLKTPLAMYMYKDSHELHVYCGWTIFIFSLIHSLFHIVRWAMQGNMYLLVQHFSGVTGVLIILSCLLICIPMTFYRKEIRYEIRKNMHYLFILFALALMFHTPAAGMPNGGFTGVVFGTIIIWYCMDATYCMFFMTEKIETTKFSVNNCGVRMTMDVSKRFQKVGNAGGVCYVCLPWIDKNQWHAFSLFENPSNPAERQIFIQKAGDWTNQVHRVLQRETVRPAWVQGPFPSPYDNAIAYDNQILVASGIGITPALSVIRAHKDNRRINLIWAVRDEALLEFFLKHLYLDHDGWNLIFYTGKKVIRDRCIHLETDTNVCIIQGRPNLKELIPNIIYGIESRQGLPENYSPDTKCVASEILANHLLASSALSHQSAATSGQLIQDLALHASELGFHLPTEAASQEINLAPSFDPSELRKDQSTRLCESIKEILTIGFRPWIYHDGARKYVKSLNKSLVMPTWGLLYCGGAKQVLNVLEEVSDEYEINLHVESFAW